MPSIAAETRREIENSPHLRQALRAGIVNFTAAARKLDVSGETEAVASALRRYAEELPPLETDHAVRVRMERGVDHGAVTVQGTSPDAEDHTAISLDGEIPPELFGRVLSAFAGTDLEICGAGVVDGSGVVLVNRGDGSQALRLIEAVLGP
ncbi:MAG: hypothetical protein ABEJ84_08385 [Halodesulfurarchaeum sp.]